MISILPSDIKLLGDKLSKNTVDPLFNKADQGGVGSELVQNKPVRVWVREFGNYVDIGKFEIFLDHQRYEENYVYFDISHMLFYPESWNHHEDNTELSNLNQLLLEEVLRNWEQKLGAEIDPDGLNGIYRYGYLPEDQW